MDKKIEEAFELNPTMNEAHQTTDGAIFPNRSGAANHCVANDLDFDKIKVTKRTAEEAEEAEETEEEKTKRIEAENSLKKAEEKKVNDLQKRIEDGTATGEDKIAVEKHLDDKSVSEEKRDFFKKFLEGKK